MRAHRGLLCVYTSQVTGYYIYIWSFGVNIHHCTIVAHVLAKLVINWWTDQDSFTEIRLVM